MTQSVSRCASVGRMPGRGMDVEKLEILRRWGGGLQADPRSEVAAAGRAILLLIEEIERLHVLVWDRRLYPDEPPPPEPEPTPPPEPAERGLTATLRDRLRRVGRAQDGIPGAESASHDGFHS